ncbi:MAG: alpha/beta hydrolase [Bauldia sp.]|nr:alpha/beta hydrolase [Bauldia sp.]
MELYGIEANPVPEGAVVGEVMASDGVKLRYARWQPTKRRTIGTVCLFQGRGECIERYFEVVGDLRKRGFAVATLDWRGQGGSDRPLRNRHKGHVDSFDEYERDLDAFMQQVVLPDCPPPYFALAHSTGGLVCLRSARAGHTRFTRMVLAAPLMGLGRKRPSPGMIQAGAALMTAIGLGELDLSRSHNRAIAENIFEGNPFTGDPDRFARNAAIYRELPQVSIGPPTFGWLHAACKAMSEAAEPDFAPAIGVPTLVMVGMMDTVVSVAAAETLADELRAGALVILPGARHELMMERDVIREQFWAAFDAFVPGSS